MVNKKQLLANIIDKSHYLQLRSKLSAPNFMVFNYHRIYREPLVTNFDEGVFGHSERVFFEQMSWIKDNFNLISENQFIETIYSGKRLPRKTAMITFDDGYIDNYEIAYPILRHLNIPATFFIPYNQIEGKTSPWWDEVAYIVKASKKEKFNYFGKEIIKDKDSPEGAVREILRSLKDNGFSDINAQIKELMTICGVSVDRHDFTENQFMNWDQIKEVSDNGISIGSHTMNHRILSCLSEDEQRYELFNSKEKIEKKIECNVNSVSYPVGGENSFNRLTLRLAQDAGYKMGFNFIAGDNEFSNKNDLFSIKRKNLSQNRSLFKTQALIPKYC